MALDLSITAAQIEFLAEDEKVTIIPNFKLDSMAFIGVSHYKLICRTMIIIARNHGCFTRN